MYSSSYSNFLTQFRDFLKQKKLIHSSSIKDLKQSKLVISSSLFFQNFIIEDKNQIDALLDPQLHKKISAVKEFFNSQSISLVVIFDGLKRYRNPNADSYSNINRFWKNLLQQKKNQSFQQIQSLFIQNQQIQKVLQENEIEYYCAPYQAFAQIRWMHGQNLASAVGATLDYCVQLDSQKSSTNFIINFDIENIQYSWIDTREIKQKLDNISFLDSFICAGLYQDKPLIKVDQQDMIKQILQVKKQDLTADQQKIFSQVKKVVDVSPSFNTHFELEFQQKMFSEVMTEIFGCFLPYQMYTYLSFDQINTRLCKMISNGVIEIDVPISDSRELHMLIEQNYQAIYSEIGGLMIEHLNEQYKSKNYWIQKYYNDKKDFFQLTPANTKNQLAPFQKFQASEEPLSFAKTLEHYLYFIKEEKKNKNTENMSIEKSHNPQLFNQNLLFLNLFKYINVTFQAQIQNKSTTKLACALRRLDPQFEELTFIVLHILQSKNISQVFGSSFNDGLRIRYSFLFRKSSIDREIQHQSDNDFEISNILNSLDLLTSEKDRQYILCISRIMGLIQPSTSYISNWKKVECLDYDVYQYFSLVQGIQSMLQDGYEAVLFNQKGNNEISFSEMKFRNNFSVEFSILIKLLLQGKIKTIDFEKGNFLMEEKQIILKEDIKKAYMLWISIFEILSYEQKKERNTSKSALYKLFEESDAFLEQKFKSMKLM